MRPNADSQCSREPSSAREHAGLLSRSAVTSSAATSAAVPFRVVRGVALPVALAACALLVGCALGSGRPMQAVSVGIADRSTCEGLYVQSIWKGEDLGGPQCQSYVALEGNAESYNQRRVQKVCEQTQIRTILSGEASSNFTAQACAGFEPRYQQARLGKACRDISRVRTRQQEDLTAAQTAACKTYLAAPGKAEARLASSGAAPAPRWGIGFASVSERAGSAGQVVGGQVVAEQAEQVVAEQAGSSERAARAERGAQAAAAEAAPVQSTAGAAVDSTPVASAAGVASVATGPAAEASAATAAPAEVARSERSICEDRLIESIWKGADVTGGAACAAYAPEYRLSRIQNVCEGALIRADRTGEALPAFTVQACRAALAPLPAAAAAAAAAGAAPAAEPSAPPPPERAAPGLDEKTIASAVDANWRSIGRDCSAVAPRSRSMEPLNVEVTVTIDVAAAGQVRSVSVRARGYRELEACIEGSVRGWVFPVAERDTEIGLPLVFAGQ